MIDQPPARALAVMAHPDDIEFMAGAAVARWAAAGTELHYLLLTDGDSGSRDPEMSRERLIWLRRAEQRRAAELMGARSVGFLGLRDGRLVASVELRLAIARAIRSVRPDAVITSDPRFYYSDEYINHPDHRAAGEATLAAVMPLANTRLAAPELLEEGLEPHDVATVYLAAPAEANYWVAVGEADVERQIAAMGAHATQVGGWDFAPMIQRFLGDAAAGARASGLDYPLAQAFRRIRLRQPE
jgi:LmbE family N-acetylglucosaminyl deacetylase